MPQIIPIKELRNTTEISDRCHAKREPIFVTRNGFGDMVVMSMETYDAILGIAEVDHAIATAEAEMQNGAAPIEAHQALAELRRKHFG